MPQGELRLFHYHAFGLRIASELELPELHPGRGPADVEIRHTNIASRDPVPDSFTAAGEIADFTFGNIGFRLTGGRAIRIEIPEDVHPIDVRLYLLGSVIGALLHQRGYFPFHANLVRLGSAAAAFAGHSGAGKSSLAAWLDERGHDVLCDDLCAVRFDPEPVVFEGIPRMKLWPETLRAFDRDQSGLTPIASDVDKFHVPLRAADRMGSLDPIVLERIYVLGKSAPGEPSGIEQLNGVDAAEALLANAYRWGIGQQILASPRTQFDQCLAIANRAAIFRVRRRWDLDRFDEEAEAIERHLETPLG